MYTLELEQQNKTFESQRYDSVLLVSFKNQHDFMFGDSQETDTLLTFFTGLVYESNIKVVILHGPTEQFDRDNSFEVFKSWSEIRRYSSTILKICNTLDQLILKLVAANKVFISALDGKMEFGFFSFSLACDCRIVTSDFTVQQPETKLGILLRDSGEFFLSNIIGALKTIEILTSDRDLTANELFELGLVDQVVTSDQSQLVNSSLKAAEQFRETPFSDIGRFKKYSAKGVEDYMKFKNKRFLEFLAGKPGNHIAGRSDITNCVFDIREVRPVTKTAKRNYCTNISKE